MSDTNPLLYKMPVPLKSGDCIGMMCPAGQMKMEDTEACRQTLQRWGYRVKTGSTIGERSVYFSGSEAERLNELQQMLDDESVDAILFARGGYGTSSLLDSINWKSFLAKPKWLIGYSDLTILHLHLAAQYNLCSLHAPMAAAFNQGEQALPYLFSLKNVLQGKPYDYEVQASIPGRAGSAEGRLLGGNMSLVLHSIGTSSEPAWDGCILFLEDVGEYLYHIDRMMVQLLRAGILRKINGLIVGGFTDMKDTTLPFGKTVEAIIMERVKTFSFPVAMGFPVGHQDENLALVHGALHRLEVDASGGAKLKRLQPS